MAAHEDDFVGQLAPADFADDVGGVRVGKEVRLHLQTDACGRPAVLHPLKALGILDRHRGSGNLRLPVRVVECAGVRRTQAGRPDRAHEDRDGAEGRGARRTGPAELHCFTISREGRVEEHDSAGNPGPRGLELLERPHDEHFGLDAWGWSADAVAEPQHDHLVLDRRDDLRALLPAYPVRHLDRFEVHVLEAVLLHFRGRPRDRVFERLRAAQAIPERVGQQRQAFPGKG